MSGAQLSPSGSATRLAKRSSIDRPRAPSATPSSSQPNKTRKKLQKNNPARRSLPVTSTSTTTQLSANTSTSSGFTQPPVSPAQVAFRLPPDLSDPKWLAYLRTSSVVDADSLSPPSTEPSSYNNTSCTTSTAATHASITSSSPRASPRAQSIIIETREADDTTPPIIPEFSHLAVHNNGTPRPSLDSSTTSSPASSTSTVSTMRRHAKTPVFSIGQLERGKPGRQHHAKVSSVSSVDLIAAQYQALLDPDEFNSTPGPRPPPLIQSESEPVLGATNRHELQTVPQSLLSPASAPPPPPPPSIRAIPARSPRRLSKNPSATSDDTLVGFDEEAIYFKPLSFSSVSESEPPSPLPKQDFRQQRASVIPEENVGLQVCTELLTRELSMAMLDKKGGASDASALQVLVMIEAYERLRDQVLEMKKTRSEGLDGIEAMFDSWLSALYSLHETLSAEPLLPRKRYEPDLTPFEAEDLD